MALYFWQEQPAGLYLSMKTTLKSLEMKGLRSFSEPSSIQFPDSGLLLFMGPSGSGKSSIFMAISHALGYSPYSATELQSWLGDEKLEVKLGLGTTKGDVTITRGPKSFIEGAESVVGASNLTPAIHKLTGLSTELLSALTYRPQGTAGLFLSKTNSEMQEFLSVLLGLNKFDEAVEKVVQNIKDLTAQYEVSERLFPIAKEAFDRSAEKPAPGQHDETEFVALAEKAKGLLNAALTAQKETLAEHASLAKQWEREQFVYTSRIADEQALHPKPVPVEVTPEMEGLAKIKATALDRINKLQAKEKTRIQAIKVQIQEKHSEHSSCEAYIKNMAQWERELAVRYAEVEKLESAICPRCKQDWVTDAIALDLKIVQDRIVELKSWLKDSADAKLKLPLIEVELEILQEQMAPSPVLKELQDVYEDTKTKAAVLVAELRMANAEAMNNWTLEVHRAVAGIREEEALAARIAMTEQDARNKVRLLIDKEVADARLVWQEATNRVQTVKKENEYARKETERLEAEWSATRDAYEQAKTKLDLTRKAVREEQDLLEMLKAFLTAIYDEVLEEIAYSTNKMLAQVPNVSHVTIKFKSETTTQKGSTKRAITPVVNLGGGERPLRSALSGGMMSAVELAVDLAVRKVISARSGAIPGWIVLDECFEGLGVADKEACLELLKQASEDTLILVIDHSSETKELFSQTITVENINGKSRIA